MVHHPILSLIIKTNHVGPSPLSFCFLWHLVASVMARLVASMVVERAVSRMVVVASTTAAVATAAVVGNSGSGGGGGGGGDGGWG